MSTNPSMIEIVLPELTTMEVSSMEFTTVKAVSSMRARFSICGRWHRWHMVRLTLAVGCKGAMVIFAVRTHTNWAHHVEEVAVVKIVTPATATGTIRHAGLSTSVILKGPKHFGKNFR